MLFQLSTVLVISSLLAPTGTGIAINGWWVIVIFLVLVAVVSVLILGNRQIPSIPPIVSHAHEPESEAHATEPEKDEIAEIPLLDDLTKIEGIGSKIAALLSEEGINTFRELANSEVDSLNRILDEARLTFADPTTWPEQARLANLQEWDALAKLQSQLKGGRKSS